MYAFLFYNQCHLDDYLFACCIFAVRRKKGDRRREHGTQGPCTLNIALIASKVTLLSRGFSSTPGFAICNFLMNLFILIF